jgi:glutathione S-transferase
MLTIHHLGISQSERIVWLCEELEIPYQLIRYKRDATTRLAPAEYKALHPVGTAPIITDGELILAESGAIIDYIITRYGDGRLRVPADSPQLASYLFWFHFANGTMTATGMLELILSMSKDSAAAEYVHARADRGFNLVEERLGEADYFAGNELTAADIIMFFSLTTLRVFAPRDLTPYPNIRAYLKRIGARPAYQRAMSKAEPGFIPLLD